MQSFYRIAAAGLALVAVAACDSRRLTSNSSTDTVPPIIDVAVPGDPNRTVDVGSPLLVNVTASDNLSLLRVEVTVTANGTRIALDTVQFTTQTPTYSKQISVQLNGVSAGTRIRIDGVALDGAGNTARDSAFINVSDDTPPDVTFIPPQPTTTTFKTGNVIRVGMNASDEAGVKSFGFEVVRFRTDSVVFFRDSAIYAVPPTSKDTTFNFTVPAGMPPGDYGVRGFATDASGNRGESEFLTIAVRDTVKPTITFIQPAVDQKFGLQDSVLVTVRIQDAVGLQRLTLVGIATRGDSAFGIVDTIVRFDSTFAPINVSGAARSFPEGTTDVTVSRWLKPTNPGDTITEPVLIVATVTDVSNNVTQATRRIQLVSGPRIDLVRPGIGSVTSAGKIVIVQLHATDRDGIIQLGYNVPELGISRLKNVPGNPVDTTITDTLFVPASTPAGTKLTISPVGFDRFGQPGSGAPVVVTVQATIADTNGPRVYQDYGPGFETDDTVRVRAIDPDGIASVGYQLKDSAGVTRDSGFRALSGTSSDETVLFQLNVPVELQGGRVRLISFGRDTRGNLGYSLPAGDTIQRSTAAAAAIDTIDVVFGRTFSLPNGGLGADIAVDTIRKNTFISNLTFDRLEVFENSTQRFNSRKVAVGADPWGMFVDGDTLLVANSAGTNISRVLISGGAAGATELINRRIKTPLSVVYAVTTTIDQSGRRHFNVVSHQFSDRPQYIGQLRRSANPGQFGLPAGTNGDIYYSTKPTLTAPEGTIRRFDPYANEAQQVWQYASKLPSATGVVGVFNADSVFTLVSTDSSRPDLIYICDHPYGRPQSPGCTSGTNVIQTIYGDPFDPTKPFIRSTGSDVVGISEIDISSLALTDTTFVAVGGDRRWVAFGEGHSGTRSGRVMMAKDSAVFDIISNSFVNFFSPSTYVKDLTNNASDRIFGLAINKTSDNVAVHGVESFFADVPDPYLLRLQGKVNTFQEGTGVAFHPDNGDVVPDGSPKNVAFVASSNGRIEIIDTYHYTNRGSLPVSANLYGPIRAVRSYATDNPIGMSSADPNFVVVKLYGLTVDGLIVIDVRNRDIKPLQ